MSDTTEMTDVTEEKKTDALAVGSLVCGICSFVINPSYLVSMAAIVLGCIGLFQNKNSKGMKIAGIATGAASILLGWLTAIAIIVIYFLYVFFVIFLGISMGM